MDGGEWLLLIMVASGGIGVLIVFLVLMEWAYGRPLAKAGTDSHSL